MRMVNRKISIILVVLVLCLVSAFSQEVVVSPTKGVWANYQSLVLDLPPNVDAYYSLSGENPLESGFAYDGPVLLELDGYVQVEVVTVDDKNGKNFYSIGYTVNNQPALSYMPLSLDNPTLTVNDENTITIPSDVQYSVSNANIFNSGDILKIDGNMLFERFVLLTVNDGAIPYRYVLKVGDASIREITELTSTSVQIDDWNYITFLVDGPVVYTIDNGPLRQTVSGKIFIERNEDHTIKWQKYEGDVSEVFNVIELPKKPMVMGMPASPTTNESVTLTLSDNRYTFAQNVSKNNVVYTNEYYIDTLQNDAFGFSEKIDIYFDGLKHGSIQPVFIIDKLAPSAPILTSSNTSGFARDSVDVVVQASDTVYYYIPNPRTSKTGFSSDEHLLDSNIPHEDVTKYTILKNNKIQLVNNSGLAQSYDVFAFTSDFAGNKSDISHYKVVLDPYNYYVSSSSLSEETLGTHDKPFTDFVQVLSVLNKKSFQNIYIDGVFTDISSLSFTKDVSLYLKDNTRLIISPDASISIDNASVSFSGGTIEQSNPDDSPELQNTLISAQSATVTFDNVEFLLSGGINSNCIVLDNSSAQILDSGVTVQTLAYGAGIKANNSVVLSKNSRFVMVAETAIGMSLVNSSAQVRDSSFTGIGALSRSLEFINSTYSVLNNNFVFSKSSIAKNNAQSTAIWHDKQTVQNTLSDNSIDGFSALIIQ